MSYTPAEERYNKPDDWFRNCGRSGLKLPAVSLGCWHNFGDPHTDSLDQDETSIHDNAQRMLFSAFDAGITHFDLANNYGPAPGAAERRVGRILRENFAGYRDELIVSTKAGYGMWPGPYGEWGSRKYLLASLDQSLKRLQLDYVDIFYSHRPDPPVSEGGAPLEETLGALDHAVRSGKALYAGISNYSDAQTRDVFRVCERDGLIKPIIHQPKYSMLTRGPEDGLLNACSDLGVGLIAFSPLEQGLLTNKYLSAVPQDSRAASEHGFLQQDAITESLVRRLNQLNDIATSRGQSLAQMAVSWILRPQPNGHQRITSALVGASRPQQILELVNAAQHSVFTPDEAAAIDQLTR